MDSRFTNVKKGTKNIKYPHKLHAVSHEVELSKESLRFQIKGVLWPFMPFRHNFKELLLSACSR